MATTPPHKSAWGDKTVSSRALTLVAVVFGLGCCLCCGPVAMSLGPSEALAKRFTVPVYPGSTQVSHWRSGGPDSMWEVSVYHTTDNIEQVVAYLEARMPGFELVNDPWLPSPFYVNGRTDRTPFGWLASRVTDPPSSPGVSVSVQPDEQEPALIVITVRYDWPAP